MKRKILPGIVIILIGIQFIRPAKNISSEATPNEISLHYTVPEDVHAMLKHSCYDCHSNNTVYPWYANVQPIGWWIQSDINEARHHLNFSTFGSYSEKKAKDEFEEIEDAATNGWMPLGSYTFIHQDTKLSPEQSKALAVWAKGLK